MKPLTLVFDLDGTLVDTALDLAGAMNAVLTANGRAPVPDADVRHMVGRGARKLIEHGFAATGAAADAAAIDGYLQHFLDHYGAHIADRSTPFPGAVDQLTALTADGHTLAVCTNKPAGLARKLLDALEMSHFFAAVLGADSLPLRKPHPLHLLGTIKQAGGDPRLSVMIGDSEVDAETAKAAGVPLVIFTFGYTAFDPAGFGADELLDSYDELPAALVRIAANLDT